jgi:predicted DCC family thiol-disulfide oxidoreductase YuxK
VSVRAPSHTLVYDGQCRVCSRLVAALEVWDRDHRIEAVPSRTAGIRTRFPQVAPHAFDAAIQLIASDGRTWSGAAALEQALNVLPRGRLIAWMFSVPFARPLADRLYRWFAHNRYRFGCGEHCRVEDGGGGGPPKPDI